MLVNDVPGEECRIAIIDERGRLDTYFAERETTSTNVGNIYKARVANVEPAIQAASAVVSGTAAMITAG